MSLTEDVQSWVTNIGKFLYYLPFYVYLFVISVSNVIVTSLTRKPKSLQGETILVTGAASGLGQQVVWKLAEKFASATFVLWDINYKGLKQTEDKCKQLGASKVNIYVVDLSSREEVVNTAAQVKKNVGPVTVLYNNVGMGRNTRFVNADLDTMDKEMRVNFFSHLWTIHEFLPEMMKSGKGHLISTCSGLAVYRFAGCGGYVASKYALRGFMETLKLEMRQHPGNADIKISVVYPGFVKTPLLDQNLTWEAMYPVYEPVEPGHVAEQIVDGILKEKPDILVPTSIKWLEIYYRLCPTQFVDELEKHLFKNLKIKGD